ncbi:hypothetical protein FACS189419_09500 [Planctomycetales bacterium]|nr:hypothetical protein FACS189419_09500 [Planctomycetales bacterium]
MGGTYPDVVQMLRQADAAKVLSCRLEIDCLPEPNRIYRRQSTEDTPQETEEKKVSVWGRMNPMNLFKPNPGAKSSDFEGTTNISSRE